MTPSRPMQPIEAFARLGRIKPYETTLSDVFQSVVDLAGVTVPGVTEASVTLVRGTDAHTPASTGGLARQLDEAQYELGEGPCLRAASSGGIESIGDMTTESRWPGWTARAMSAGACSSLSIGLSAQAGVGAALNLYATEPRAFDDDAVAVAQAFAGFAGLALANDHLNNVRVTLEQHVEAAMDSEAVVEQAKGVVIGDRGCTAEEAFVVLTTMARDSGRTVRAVAQALVAGAAEIPARSQGRAA